MRKRGLCCRPVFVCLSVRPSVTMVDGIKTAEDIVKLLSLSRPGSAIILVFSPTAPIPNSNGNPLSRGTKFTVEFCDFRLKSPFISETVQDKPIVAMER